MAQYTKLESKLIYECIYVYICLTSFIMAQYTKLESCISIFGYQLLAYVCFIMGHCINENVTLHCWLIS